MNSLITRYNRLPKWFRFSVHVATWPVQVAVAMALGPFILIVNGVIESWNDFK